MEIKSTQFLISNTDLAKCPKADKAEYAFIGRSNVGKSSLINSLANNQKLAKVSGTPGKTQLINHFLVKSGTAGKDDVTLWYLVDLPGYGFAKVSARQRKQWEKMIEGYLRNRSNLITVFVLIDSRHEPQQLDLDFIDQLGEWGVPFNLIFTKADKSKQSEVAHNVKSFVSKLKEHWETVPRTFVTSAEKGTGRREVLSYIDELNIMFDEDKKAGLVPEDTNA